MYRILGVSGNQYRVDEAETLYGHILWFAQYRLKPLCAVVAAHAMKGGAACLSIIYYIPTVAYLYLNGAAYLVLQRPS